MTLPSNTMRTPNARSAAQKGEASGRDILYLCQDMREFELYGTVRAVVSVCDSLNYILDTEDLTQVFRLVNNYLDPGGVFIFDLNTDYKYSQMGDETIAENREDGSFIWDNYYHREERINEYDLTLFIRENAESGETGEGQLYRKYTETHYQRGYTLDEIKELLREAGLIFRSAHDMDTSGEVSDKSERICVIAQESGKE